MDVVYIIQYLPKGDRPTGAELFTYVKNLSGRTYRVVFYDVQNNNELLDTFQEIQCDVGKDDHVIIQLEAHGGDDIVGMDVANHITWMELLDVIRPINVATNNNVILSLSTCLGLKSLLSIRLDRRSPFGALIGPTRPMYDSDLANGYKAFYRELSSFDNLREPMKALCLATKTPDLQDGSPEWLLTCEALFDKLTDVLGNSSIFDPIIKSEAKKYGITEERARKLVIKKYKSIRKRRKFFCFL